MKRVRRRERCHDPHHVASRITGQTQISPLMRCIGRERTNINDLPHSLLQEILKKANHRKWLRRCRLVCKLWRSLIPTCDPPFALISNIRFPGHPAVAPHYTSESSVFQKLKGFNLGYLPFVGWKGKRSVCVQASCKDLLLCAEFVFSQDQFCIVNPWTMDWFALPEIPFWAGIFPVGLVAKKSPLDPMGYRFKVVRVSLITSVYFKAQLFDPNINGWSQVRVSHPYGLSWQPEIFQGLVYNGILHWVDKNGPIVAYDPFAPPDRDGRLWCRFIPRSDPMKHSGDVSCGDNNMSMKECVTVSEGYICMVQLIMFPKLLEHGDEAHNLTVWKLEDYEGGKWVLEHRIYFKDMVSEVPELQQYVREFVNRNEKYEQVKLSKLLPINREDFQKYGPPVLRRIGHEPEPLACHPNNTQIVYMSFPSSIVACNLLTKTLKLVSKSLIEPHFLKFDRAVPISASLQPTPVPRCPNNGPNHHWD